MTTTIALSVRMEDDGTLKFIAPDGNPASEAMIEAAKAQKGVELRALAQRGVDEVNSKIEALGRIHLFTPSPNVRPVFEPVPFSAPEPAPPVPKGLELMDRIFISRRRAIEDSNQEARESYARERTAWLKAKAEHETAEGRRKTLVEQLIYRSATAMEIYLEDVLQDIVWPRESSVTFEVSEDLQRIRIAADLPEIEDLPRKTASLPARGYKASIKEISDAKLRKLYAAHVHGVGFRIVGEAFAALPSVNEVVLSSFSQRPDPRTGQPRDEFLYSVRVKRDDWQRIDFQALAAIDVVEALTAFELRRDMTKTGVFKAIEPITL